MPAQRGRATAHPTGQALQLDLAEGQANESLRRGAVYEALSVGFLYPGAGSGALLRERIANALARSQGQGAALRRKGAAEAAQSLEALARAAAPLEDAALLTEHTRLFGHGVLNDCSPYEAEYGQAHIFQKSQTLADLMAFYQAFGVGLHPDLKDRLDHISVELEFMQLLAVKEAYALAHHHDPSKLQLCRDAQQAFLAGHLSQWAQPFARRVRRKAGEASVYHSLARLLEVHIAAELAAWRLPVPPASPEPPFTLEEDPESCALEPDAMPGGRAP